MVQKKLRVSDVVVITSPVGIENRYGWLGLIEYFKEYPQPVWGVRISEETQGFIAEYPTESLEVIDYINEEPIVSTNKKFKNGDVVVYCGEHLVDEIYGELGIVIRYANQKIYVEFPDGNYFCNPENLEVIDHINPDEPDVDEDDDQWPKDCEQCPGNHPDETPTPDFKVGDRIIYTGDTTPRYKGKTAVITDIIPNIGDTDGLLVKWDDEDMRTPSPQLVLRESIEHYKGPAASTPSKFKVGDRVKYTGILTPKFIGRTGTVWDAWPNNGNLQVTWDNPKTDATVEPGNVTLIQECSKTPETPKFKVGDRVIYTGDGLHLRGMTGTIEAVSDDKEVQVRFDYSKVSTTIQTKNIKHYNEIKSHVQECPKKEYNFHDVKMHFNARVPIVCFDCSGSRDLYSLQEQWNQYKQAVKEYTNWGYVFGIKRPHSVPLDNLSFAFEWVQGIGDLQPVLEYAKPHGSVALLIFSDGVIDLSVVSDSYVLDEHSQLRTVIITPKNEVMFYKGGTLTGQGTITPPRIYYKITKPSLSPEAMEQRLHEILNGKAEDALKQVQHQEDLGACGITEHPIQGTQRTLRLERGNTVAKVICKSCNQTIKEIHLDQ